MRSTLKITQLLVTHNSMGWTILDFIKNSLISPFTETSLEEELDWYAYRLDKDQEMYTVLLKTKDEQISEKELEILTKEGATLNHLLLNKEKSIESVFRFRVYCELSREFIPFSELTYEGNPATIKQIELLLKGEWPGFIPNLYFGKGENNCDIYQDDIIELINDRGEKIQVVCCYGKAQRVMSSGKLVEITGFYFRCNNFPTYPIITNYKGVHDTTMFKVIGNIRQTPELLNN